MNTSLKASFHKNWKPNIEHPMLYILVFTVFHQGKSLYIHVKTTQAMHDHKQYTHEFTKLGERQDPVHDSMANINAEPEASSVSKWKLFVTIQIDLFVIVLLGLRI